MHKLFSRSAASGILVNDRGIDDLSFLDTLLDPQIRLHVFVRLALVGLDEVLEYFCVGVCENDARRLSACRGIPSGMLPCTMSTRPCHMKPLHVRKSRPTHYRSSQTTPPDANQAECRLTMMRVASAARTFTFAMLESMCIRMGCPSCTNICLSSIPEILHAST